MNRKSLLMPEQDTENYPTSMHGTRNSYLGKIISVQDIIDLLSRVKDKSSPVTLDSDMFCSRIELSKKPDGSVRLGATVINPACRNIPQSVPTQYYRTESGQSFDAVRLESVLVGHHGLIEDSGL